MKTNEIGIDVYRAALRNDFMTFTHRTFAELNPQANFLWAPHLQVIASKLDAVRRGEVKRLIINLPPRSLKSHMASVALPAFILGHDPSAQIIAASYGQELAEKHARDSRTLMGSAFYKSLFPGTRLSPDKQSINDFVTTMKGFRMSTSVGGTLTGRGAGFIIIDDPIKPDEALSESRRNAVNGWFDNTLRSRLNSQNDGAILVVMQRLHQDDLVGHVLEQGLWEVVSFPAFAEEDEAFTVKTIRGPRTYRRKKGEVLHPARESATVLGEIRHTIGEYNFQSQYQQSPMPLEGLMIRHGWLKYYAPQELPTRFSNLIQSWDTANKSGELNNYSVCTTWGYVDKRFYLLHVIREKLNYPDLKRRVITHAKEFRKYNTPTVLIEDKASGTQLLQDLQREGVFPLKAYEPPPGNDKIMRLHAQSALFENGRVFLPADAPWLAEYVKELTGFPGSKYSDQVDSTTQALDYLNSSRRSIEIWERMAN